MPKPIRPMEIRLTEDGKRNILEATVENIPFMSAMPEPPPLVYTTYLRNKAGGYSSPTNTEGKFYNMQQLDIIAEMQEHLKRIKKNNEGIEGSDRTVLVVHGDKDQKLNFKEATKYISTLKAQHLTREHVVTEMKDLVTYASKLGGISADDNLRLSEFAEENKLKLTYSDVSKNATVAIEDLTNHQIQKVNKVDIRTRDKAVVGL